MDKITIDYKHCFDFYNGSDFSKVRDELSQQNRILHEKSGKGNDYLGWIDLPVEISKQDIDEINDVSNDLRSKVDYIVCVGIGGSYLGAKAIIEALSNSFDAYQQNRKARILYAGHNISEDYLAELSDFLKDKRFAIVVISKSGTTTEPAIAFRVLKDLLISQLGKEKTGKYIVAITDKEKGALKTLASEEGYKTFIIPDDVGGRFSVLSPVGLLPIALAGFDIQNFVDGAVSMHQQTGQDIKFEDNIAAQYAAIRNVLYRNGKTVEILVNYHPKLHYVAEWWKQLYGESEGKENKGIFPASVDLTTDLHSMGQYIQDGMRMLFETVISVAGSNRNMNVPFDESNLDKLNYISGKSIDEVNKMAELGTMIAHVDGGVPNIRIVLPKVNEFYLGQLIYFFEKACGLSGYLLGVNPFDQPGVEDYKRNMFALLGKPGFEKETEELRKRI